MCHGAAMARKTACARERWNLREEAELAGEGEVEEDEGDGEDEADEALGEDVEGHDGGEGEAGEEGDSELASTFSAMCGIGASRADGIPSCR